MSMYLPNSAVRPAQSDPVEFIDIPPMASEGHGGTSAVLDAQDRPIELSSQARLDVTRRARDYIRELVANRGGGTEDVRSIIDDLHDEMSVRYHRSAR